MSKSKHNRNILEDRVHYRSYEIGYDIYTGYYVVSKDLSDNRYRRYEVCSIEEGIEFINDVLLDTSELPNIKIPYPTNDEEESKKDMLHEIFLIVQIE